MSPAETSFAIAFGSMAIDKDISREASAFMKSLATLLLFTSSLVPSLAQTQPGPIVLTGGDLRPSQSLNGPWHVIPDPYQTGLYDFHNHELAKGWFANEKAKPGDTGPIDYDFSKAQTINVPGDWNTQKPEFFWYEGLMWYERDFDFTPQERTHTYLRIGAANYKSIFWSNGKKVCEH